MKKHVNEKSSSSMNENSKANSCFGILLLLILSFPLIPNEVNADFVGVSYFYPTITIFDDETWEIVSSGTLTLTGFNVGYASSVTWNSDSGLFYATVKASNDNVRRLVTVNPSTGVCTDIGSMLISGFNTLTYSSITKTLYTMGDDEKLYSVDMTNGAPTFLGGPYTVSSEDGEVIAYNKDDGFIYHWSGTDSKMEKINTSTFIATPIVQTGIYHFQIFGAVYIGGGEFIATDQEYRALRITSSGVVSLQTAGLPFWIRGLGYSDSILPKTLNLTALVEGFYNDTSEKMIRDTATVYLRNTTSPYSIIDSAKSILDSSGQGVYTFFNNTANGTPYYIVFKHRNSIESWSSGGNSFSLSKMTYNFTTAASQAYGDNLILKGSRYCIQSGDCNQDGKVDLSDQLMIHNNNSISGYVPTDVNGNLVVDISDLIIAYNNSQRFASVSSPLETHSSQNKWRRLKQKISTENVSESFKLKDNYPNPFNPVTNLEFGISKTGFVSLKVYDMLGKEVATLVNENLNPGTYKYNFDGSKLSSGIYFYVLEAGDYTEVKKMTLLK